MKFSLRQLKILLPLRYSNWQGRRGVNQSKWQVSFQHRLTDHNKGAGHENIHRKSGAYQLFL